MAGTIDQAKMKFSRMVNSRSYTRFNQSQNPDGESSRVEVKLAVDGEEEEEMEATEQEHVPREMFTRSSHSQPSNKFRILVVLAVGLIILFVGILIGYSSRSKSESPSCSNLPAPSEDTFEDSFHETPVAMDWTDVVRLLKDKLSNNAIKEKLSKFSLGDRSAGSPVDNQLGNRIHELFKDLNMEPWVVEHYVKLQYPSSTNKVFFGQDVMEYPEGFLAYSETGLKEGRVVYANYGKLEDLQTVQREINLTGTVVLMRAGKISMAQKVMNAAKMGAVAALIYPDPADFKKMDDNMKIFGHVHLGSGDPYTPGFPSFNHTQFPPAKSSGLPGILAQTITANMAKKIISKMGGNSVPNAFKGNLFGVQDYKFGSENDKVSVAVNNSFVDTKIHNVFGVIKGYLDPDRYVVIGAQRDSLGSGYAKSTVGTVLLMELARAFNELKKDGFKPKRSIVFVSWTAGDFGNVGATEWLEGYWSSLDRKAITYISLDGVVTGNGFFRASASPLLHTLLQRTLEKVTTGSGSSLLQSYGGGNFAKILTPMQMDDGAYPFLAFSGIPSVSFSFTSNEGSSDYNYFGTNMDNKEQLDSVTNQGVVELSVLAAQVAGQMALRLVHDQIIRLDVKKYTTVISENVDEIIKQVNRLKNDKVDKIDTLSIKWLNEAKGSYDRAASDLINDIRKSDLDDVEMCRIINNRIMKVEHNFLSPYVSLRDVPFRHIFFGNGWQTAADMKNNLEAAHTNNASFNIDQMLNKFALLTWTIQGSANDLAGEIWTLDNEI